MAEGVFSKLDEGLQKALDERKWIPTPVQEVTQDEIASGHDRLIVAPTGSGKTMAAMLPLLDRCLRQKWDGMSILYITPLRALNRDVDRRLDEITSAVGLTLGLRHGDTPQSERNKHVRKPPNVMITTPETFQLMFTGSRLRELLRTVKAVVIDEVHEMAGGERGWQLALGLSRLEAFKGSKIQKIGLSATVGNPEQVATWLSDEAEAIKAVAPRSTELSVDAIIQLPEDEIGSLELAISPRAHATLRGLADLISKKHPCLVFVNSRNSAETVSQRLQAIAPDLNIGVHHGSLARETRTQMEDDLRNGNIEGLVCTSSLELGIDVGSVNHIVQIRSPRSVDRMLQRVGRADHRLGGIGSGHLLGWESDDLIEAAVIARKAISGEIEPVEWREQPLLVAANQIVMMVHSHGALPIDAVTEVISNSGQFSGWRREDTIGIGKILADGWVIRCVDDPQSVPWYRWPHDVWQELIATSKKSLPDQPKLAYDEEPSKDLATLSFDAPPKFSKGWISRSGRTRQWVTNHLSMIPDKQSYRVRDAVTRQSLGNVDEAFVLSLNDGGEEADGRQRRFVMAGRTWIVIDADPEQNELLVAPVSDQGHAPQWVGELPPTPADVAREAGRLRRLFAIDLGLMHDEEITEIDPAGLLNGDSSLEDYPLNGEAKGILADIVSTHFNSANMIPSDRLITIEDRGEALVINCCQGNKINEAIGHYLLAMASTRSGRWGRLIVEPCRISLQVAGVTPSEIIEWISNTPPEALEGVLSVTLPNSREVRWRFAQVAKVFGILRHGVDPRKINLQALLKKYRGTPVMEEVLGKLFHERMDITGAKDVLRGIQSGLIGLEVTASGPLGISSKSEKDLLLPNFDNEQVRARLEGRLMNERAVLCCLKCNSVKRFRVARYPEMTDAKKCLKCGGQMLACMREGLEKQLLEWVKSDDGKDRDRMMKNAQAVANRGMDAILALMGRGIGEATCQRLMRKVQRGDTEGLLEAIHIAEIEYARTRRFWG
ncbi:MAG: DEAD/DEAH box helicase [Euryarchaeota archaeon]|jgi:ATP-dependent Lhr-like helicase|nr:DEAD/DEAH box helicase [Euryarchaeota archaeon]MBT4982832.1 DEAD/DEAH box helicase [Euryarchaeota archaeon]MBT5184024.1 DEAD/DEAH box helicase [Euryarchaeota archaeon]